MSRPARFVGRLAVLLSLLPLSLAAFSLTGCDSERGGVTAEPETPEESTPDDMEI
ncbi:hypothetical protein [Alienimonas californiensis]|uniref:Uncharacterized protein n=1 Tax=Alienimonas californiensis TaxID=2527989 RepID=A0A517P5U7_9PLAN|nr:hypothetical protein [Alienimonas californiensis]QDT14758.1 hypothetical protein CA12_08370 [Alienimonas californiensis]